MILLQPLLARLHRRHGRRCTLIGPGPWTQDVYREQDDVELVCNLQRHSTQLISIDWWHALAVLLRSPESHVYVCETDKQQLDRVRRLLNIAGTQPARCWSLLNSLAAPADSQPGHWLDRLQQFADVTARAFASADCTGSEELTASTVANSRGPRLQIPAEVMRECWGWCAARGWLGRRLILVQPGNRRTMRSGRIMSTLEDSKAWGTESWATLLQKVQRASPSALILVCGAPEERGLLDAICATTNIRNVVAATPSLPILLALCASAYGMISVDSGPAHAAAALGTPLLVLFGENPQSDWLPRSHSGAPVIGVGGPPWKTRLADISVDEAFDAWQALQSRIFAHGPTRFCSNYAPQSMDAFALAQR